MNNGKVVNTWFLKICGALKKHAFSKTSIRLSLNLRVYDNYTRLRTVFEREIKDKTFIYFLCNGSEILVNCRENVA